MTQPGADLDLALSKIRRHTTSSLEHQKFPATLLLAIEATLDERKIERSPTAYFAALLTALGGTLQPDVPSGLVPSEGDMLPTELYLLSFVAPFVPPPVIRGNLDSILSLTSPLFPLLTNHAPPLRSQIGLYGSVFRALDRSKLEVQGVRQCFASVLQLCLDARPKVRKQAAEVVKDTLSSPPTPLMRHPYSDRVAEWVKSTLTDVSANVLSRSKHTASNIDKVELALHLLSLLRQVILKLPFSSLSEIVTLLLSLPRLGNPFLSQSAYSILSDVLSAPTRDDDFNVVSEIPQILNAVLSSLPPRVDKDLAPAWLGLLGNSLLVYKNADPNASAGQVGKVWKAVWAFLDSPDATIRAASCQTLVVLAQCFTHETIKLATQERGQSEPRTALGKIVLQAEKAFESLAFARSMSPLLLAISALISNLRYREMPGGPTAAELLLLPLVQRIGNMRTEKTFEHKEAADRVLSLAMGTMGPAVLLNALPLNLEPGDRQAGREPRAFLLPLLAQPHPSPLRHFVSYFVPLSERMFNLKQKAESESRPSEAKMWAVLISQVWAGLPGYCWAKADTEEAFSTVFAQMLSQVLYTQVELRSFVLRALNVLVDSNLAIASQDPSLLEKLPSGVRTDSISQEQAAKNVDFLRSQAESWLAVLFNVFGSVNREARGAVGDVITAWLGIAGDAAIAQGYCNVFDFFKQNLTKPQSRGSTNTGSPISMTQDIFVILLPHLSTQNASELFDATLSNAVLVNPDNGVQKRGYNILARLVESGKLSLDAETLIKRLDEFSDTHTPAAKKDRLQLYANVLPLIPPSALHVIPCLIPEAILGTKEPSEKARCAAFDLLIAMGKKMAEGGVVKRDLVNDMEEDGIAKASIEEYITMIAAGLAGATPHMISATVTAISRLVFEFKDEIPAHMLTDILSTLLIFLSSANREIVKSTLGFIKLAVHTLPENLMRPQLPQLVPALLRWAHDHKNHFKIKVRHIFERMIRRFGFQDVHSCTNGEEAARVLVNIKKRKDRAKRKKAFATGDDIDKGPAKMPTTGDAFEDVLYGSESDLSDSDEVEEEVSVTTEKRKDGDFTARLRLDDDEPMDLLSGAASRVTSTKGSRRSKHGEDATHFKADEETGKMIIEESDSDVASIAEPDVAGTAYREALTSVDGFTRGPSGYIKFNKDTKRQRRKNEDEDEDIEMVEAERARSTGKKRSETKLGHEFRAKKAGGDLKKGRLDPYAYVPLKQAAKKGARHNRLGVAGKR
ncbi:NUC173-domain-containing protein [Russula earlei]|uniref:NUC173-domain-containing protein n=1 Tax=Russula earlei TaxID=71964 RepID=A0ACC0UDF3_9AGAM|nr:NUC173-domain-containing protein [Russula earlei]